MSRHFYVTCEPLSLVIGGYSHGGHVFTSSPERAAECMRHNGFQPVTVRECPGFDCTCTRDAVASNSRRLNIDFTTI